MQRRRVVGLLFAFAIAIAWGCDKRPTRSSVQGEVKLDGQPVDGGRITFIPAGAGVVPAQAPITGGKYQLTTGEGPSLGKCKVEIVWSKTTGRKINDPRLGAAEELKQVIPAKYNDKSTLSFEIKPGDNVYSVDLKSK
jgi:hypothetical protein